MNQAIIVEEKDKYCRKCGGFVDLVSAVAKLTAPPQYQYYCKSCCAHVLTVTGETYTNVQDKSS